ncbi:hypothetical protein DEI93_02685 [Curtobacterium sp. MCBD17_035]|uniref:hypothetical protein n=1 Tax=Curtobacterium sp. MCBD17_035 TaxID=2175673 RepID=UPI0011B8444B|nr:hypothetical protein [Curtobacterium sp. MCBD17_035]WIB67967.1 hypothetical protein DEI93_02685 [Curtobacterium sp. MCBD17_035]
MVLLTATVHPNVSDGIHVVDPEIRLAQYRTAIADWESWSSRLGFRLALVETSGAPADRLLSEVPPAGRPAIDVVHYAPSSEEVTAGKGRIESAAVIHAISALVADDALTVFKCTGRLRIANPQAVISAVGAASVRLRMTLDRTFADTRLIGAAAHVWRDVLLKDREVLDDTGGIYLEHLVAAEVARASALSQIAIERFPSRPLFIGLSGSTGRTYVGRRFPALGARLIGGSERLLGSLAARKQV